MKCLFTLFFSCILLLFVSAQEQEKNKNDYRLAVRLSPLALLDPFETNLSIGIDYKVRKRLSVGGDIAVYIIREAFAENKPLSGFYVRPTLRWYSNDRLKLFTELVLMYKHTVRKENDWLGMDCVDDVPAYEKFTSYKQVRDVFDLSFRGGIRENLFQLKNWYFEFYLGIGLRQKFHSIKYNEPNTCAQRVDGFFDIINQNPSTTITTASLPCGIRLVWVLK